MKVNLFEAFKKYEKHAENLQDFFEKYHKPINDNEQRENWFMTAQRDLKKYGYVLIPGGTTTTGDNCTYYKNN